MIEITGTLTAAGDFPVVDVSEVDDAVSQTDLSTAISGANQYTDQAVGELSAVVTHFFDTCDKVRAESDPTEYTSLFVGRRMYLWDPLSTAGDQFTEKIAGPLITPPAAATLSSHLLIEVTRLTSDSADTYETSAQYGTAAANIALLSVDCHAQVAGDGSLNETSY